MGGSINLIEIMEEFGVKKIVFSSSCTVFGVPEKLPIDENHPTGKCINPYGRTKFIFEEFLKDICSAHEVMIKIRFIQFFSINYSFDLKRLISL